MSMKIDKENDVVAYNDAEHKYIEKSTGMVCVSATSLIHKFTQPFDATFWSCAKALEALVTPEQFASVKEELYRKKKFDDKYVTKFGIQPEEFIQKKYEILDAWKTKNEVACERGTAIHKMHEDRHMSGNTKELQHLGLGGTFKLYTTNKIIPRESGIYPELLMHRISEDGKLRIAGQADLVIIDGTDVHLLDYKTNAEIKKSSYYNPTTRQRQMMQYPLNNIQDCNYMHYQLQLSLYMWMILKAHPELTPKSLTIIHYDHKDKMTLYDIPYLEKDVERMLAYYKGKMIKEEMYEKLKPIEY